MRPISSKKIVIALLILFGLSRLDQVLAVASGIYHFFANSLQPFYDMPSTGRFVNALLILALLYITVFKLLYGRRK